METVIFDFGNVIEKVDKGPFFEFLAESSGKSVEEVREIYFPREQEYEKGEMTTDEFLSFMKEEFSVDIPRDELRERFTSKFEHIPETDDLVRELKEEGYRLQILSDIHEMDYEDVMEESGVFPLFDAITLSFRVGTTKPDPAIYRDALSKTESAPEECVFIDDREENVEGAEEVGIHGIHYTDPESLRRELRELGIEEV